jgi:hypothetical protein
MKSTHFLRNCDNMINNPPSEEVVIGVLYEWMSL